MKSVMRYLNVLLAAALLAAGCGGAKVSVKTGGSKMKTDADGNVVLSQEARKDFEAATQELADAEKKGLDPATCDGLAKKFENLASKHGIPDAAYNVGAVLARCGKEDEARKAFDDAISAFGKHVPTKQRALTYLAYLDLRAGQVDAAEAKIKQAISLGRNTLEAVPAYVYAGTILRQRAMAGDNSSWQKAQKALRTALAIDAKYMPALYQLAKLYYSIAVKLQKKSYLTLAMLVVDQAKKIDPEFAPIYLILGQILLEKNELVEALKAFEAAFTKDPNFYEAYMSFGAINLSFRGYEAAMQAFEKAVALRPDSYDAHMGLGVAARGLGDFARAKAEYEKCKNIDKERTDYIFNLGVLAMDYENPGTPEGYRAAKKIFETFLAHATEAHKIDPDGKGPEKSWVEKAKERIENCEKAAKQIEEAERQMAELQRLAEEQKKREEEQARLAKQAEELAKKEAEGQQAAPAEEVDEKEIEKELAEEEARKAEEAKKKQEAEEQNKESAPEEQADQPDQEAPEEKVEL